MALNPFNIKVNVGFCWRYRANVDIVRDDLDNFVSTLLGQVSREMTVITKKVAFNESFSNHIDLLSTLCTNYVENLVNEL